MADLRCLNSWRKNTAHCMLLCPRLWLLTVTVSATISTHTTKNVLKKNCNAWSFKITKVWLNICQHTRILHNLFCDYIWVSQSTLDTCVKKCSVKVFSPDCFFLVPKNANMRQKKPQHNYFCVCASVIFVSDWFFLGGGRLSKKTDGKQRFHFVTEGRYRQLPYSWA